MFKNAIMWLKDTGILDKIKYDVMNPPIPRPDPTVRHNKPLILKQLGIIMIVLVVGLTIGTIVFFIEFCKRPKPRKAPESAGGIDMTEQQVTRAIAASNLTLPPVIIE